MKLKLTKELGFDVQLSSQRGQKNPAIIGRGGVQTHTHTHTHRHGGEGGDQEHGGEWHCVH